MAKVPSVAERFTAKTRVDYSTLTPDERLELFITGQYKGQDIVKSTSEEGAAGIKQALADGADPNRIISDARNTGTAWQMMLESTIHPYYKSALSEDFLVRGGNPDLTASPSSRTPRQYFEEFRDSSQQSLDTNSYRGDGEIEMDDEGRKIVRTNLGYAQKALGVIGEKDANPTAELAPGVPAVPPAQDGPPPSEMGATLPATPPVPSSPETTPRNGTTAPGTPPPDGQAPQGTPQANTRTTEPSARDLLAEYGPLLQDQFGLQPGKSGKSYSGADATAIQTMLKAADLDLGNFPNNGVDGKIGRVTLDALDAFAQNYGLTPEEAVKVLKAANDYANDTGVSPEVAMKDVLATARSAPDRKAARDELMGFVESRVNYGKMISTEKSTVVLDDNKTKVDIGKLDQNNDGKLSSDEIAKIDGKAGVSQDDINLLQKLAKQSGVDLGKLGVTVDGKTPEHVAGDIARVNVGQKQAPDAASAQR